MRKLVALMIAFCPVFLFGTPAQKCIFSTKCSTDLLARMAEEIGLDSLCLRNSVNDSVLLLPCGDEQLRVTVKSGIIDHIGLRLFSDTLREAIQIAAPLDYLERESLLNRLAISKEVSAERESMVHDVRFDGTTLDGIPTIARQTKDVTVNFIDERTYSVIWNIDSIHTASVLIPANYSLLRGTTLPENERRLFDDLCVVDSLTSFHSQIPIDEDLVQGTWKLNCFVIKGNSLLSKHLNSDRYYQLSESESGAIFEALYNESYPVESFSNLLKGLNIPNDFTVQVKMVVYPRTMLSVNVKLSSLAKYFIEHGCEIFTIPTNVSDEQVRFWMICKNTQWGYCHSLRVTFNAEDVESRGGIATASLASFIPFNKINNFFAEQDL